MAERDLGTLSDLVDLDGATTLREAVVERLGPAAARHDIHAITRAYRDAINDRLPDDLVVDEDDRVILETWIEDNPRELLDDALFAADLDAIIRGSS
ncbi:hypothetical protein [Umezawaea sp. NPDC059074]|uniref:hypothetical protein n=1 Tax=Umezawaea sp. NPDC059074 TaxID=3346716 RepID=UPI00368F4FA5